jgi:hypothetical protein
MGNSTYAKTYAKAVPRRKVVGIYAYIKNSTKVASKQPVTVFQATEKNSKLIKGKK